MAEKEMTMTKITVDTAEKEMTMTEVTVMMMTNH
jgi:hypothetical protein